MPLITDILDIRQRLRLELLAEYLGKVDDPAHDLPLAQDAESWVWGMMIPEVGDPLSVPRTDMHVDPDFGREVARMLDDAAPPPPVMTIKAIDDANRQIPLTPYPREKQGEEGNGDSSSDPVARECKPGPAMWCHERKEELRRHVLTGIPVKDIAQAMGLRVGQIDGNITRFGWRKDYQDARARRTGSIDRSAELEAIERHIREKGVSTSVNFGKYQPMVDFMRSAGYAIYRDRNNGWVLNDSPLHNKMLWRVVNAERRRRGMEPMKPPSS